MDCLQLKKLDAYGFKSFADRIEVDFDKGITAIVGPNGSGKSNISDAIKWVLGEQNIRNIRGTKAEDVIFAGSEVRRPMNVAEVSLYFDNDGTLPVDFHEVVVTRRLFRTGESEFYINRSRCRLKDIADLFADSGVGHDSMGIISQNKMDEILNARPEEKRLFFEEAAGISKYRSRKKEAVRKLDDTEGNLQRIHDILGEIANQLEPLRLSAERAAKYQQLQKIISKLQLTGIYHQYQDFLERRQIFDRQIQDKMDQEIAASTAMQLIEGRRSQLDAEIIRLEKSLEELAAGRNEIHDRLKAADSRIQVLEERRRQGKANCQRHRQQMREISAGLAEAAEGIRGLQAVEESAKTKYQAVVEEIRAKRQTARNLRESLVEIRNQLQRMNQEDRDLERKIQSADSRRQVLERLQSSYEGFGRAARAVLKSNEPWHKGVCGAVAELLRVPRKYIAALETALGGALQNIVTRDTDTAKGAIEFLKCGRLGRATFLPLSSIIVRENRENIPAHARGVLGWGNELADTDLQYQMVADFLLGKTLVVDTLDNALALNKSMGQRLRIVTLEGELLSPGGVLSGGSRQQRESSFLNRREEISTLAGKLEGLKQQEAVLQEKRKSLEENYSRLDQEAENLAEATGRLEMDKAMLEQQSIRAREQILLRQREIKRYEENAAIWQAEMEKMEKELSESLAEISRLMEDCNRHQQEYQRADEGYKAVYRQRMERLAEKKENDKEVREANNRQQDIKNQLHQVQLSASKIDFELEQCRQELLSRYGLVPERAAEEVLDLEPGELKRKSRAIEGQIRSLGVINPNAPQELAELQKRHEFLSGNARDLEKGREDLLQLIQEMEEAMTRQFREAFIKINEYFKEIFIKLFGGGRAGIQLTDSKNVLEAGVNIMVTIPGKKPQNLAVLSGGERALTVVALLFSFLKYRPAPFSVLDEIDAPLDEANIARFGRFLREYAERTQFIMVTHRKGTMEAADTMYGVTIEDAGVSKVISVRLQDYEAEA